MLSAKIINEVNEYICDHWDDGDKTGKESIFQHGLSIWPFAHSISPTLVATFAHDGGNLRDILLTDYISRAKKETFSEALVSFIDSKKLCDSDVYKRAKIDRRLYSKIRTQKNYQPSKKTVLCFAIALELSLDETLTLLSCAGYALSHSNKSDLIVEYFIMTRNFDCSTIDEALEKFNEAPLFS